MDSWDSLGLETEVISEFVGEAMDGLDGLRSCLLHFGSKPEENLNAVYRWVHTVKGTAGFLNLKAMQSFAHKYENFLQKLQAREEWPTLDEIAVIEEGVDLLQDALEKLMDKEVQLADDCDRFISMLSEQEGDDGSDSLKKTMERLNGIMEQCEQFGSDKELKIPEEVLNALTELEELVKGEQEDFNIELTCTVLTLKSVTDSEGNDWSEPVQRVLIGLEELINSEGNLSQEHVQLVEEHTQNIHNFLYAGKDEKQFDWDTAVTLARLMPEALEEFWVKFWKKSILENFNVEFIGVDALSAQLLGMEEENPEPVKEKVQEAPAETKTQETVRVDANHFNNFTRDTDILISHTNYLETLTRLARKSLPADVARDMREGMTQLQNTIGSFQEALVSIRATRMTELFERLPRMVRKLERDLGKKVNLKIKGETLEVDRSVIHLLADPMVHLVRNALDHGLESPEERLEKGKPESGTLTVEAVKDDDWLLLTIKEDGRGINKEKVLEKAIEKGLVDKSAVLQDDEIYKLILLPGFSLARQVSDVSGRGVGMDVVMNTLSSHGGSLSIESSIDEGSNFILKYPLEDNLRSRQLILFESGEKQYAVRQEIMREVVEVENNEWWLDDNENIFYHQTQESHYVSLKNLWYGEELQYKISNGKMMVLEDKSGQRIAFHIDRVLRTIRATIKPFNNDFLLSLQWFEGSIVTGREAPIPVLSSENLNVFL